MSAWFAALFKFYDKSSHREILITFWGLWTARNKFLFEGLSQRPDNVATFVRSYCREMQILQDRMKSGIPRSTEWIAPNFPFVKINYDSSFRQDVFSACTVLLSGTMKDVDSTSDSEDLYDSSLRSFDVRLTRLLIAYTSMEIQGEGAVGLDRFGAALILLFLLLQTGFRFRIC
ncbi:hypothetical protein V6N12_043092 [Hibiscus sabdariffa]|uniref:Uncharacterized protein n=1 Tax=Hibiscus sabdariffa TaxID=183260 RepID=A0ABR2DI73_9ROSI